MVQAKSNSSTIVWLIYASKKENNFIHNLDWCTHSQEFLPQYKKLAGHLYKLGDLTDTIFFAKVDNDMEGDFIKH
jgi:hypothetical protein